MRFLFFLSIYALINCSTITAQSKAEAYINRYKDIAIIEMHRTGIPASVKLGQAIIESSYGQSVLSNSSNNHFGIKCKKGWTGQKYYHKDDDKNKQGQLIKSCFRVYTNVEASFIDHSEFLMKRDRYAFLFTFKSTDYKQWAYGLKSAGYATAKGYDKKLIRIIETYYLDQYDQVAKPIEGGPIIAHTFEENEDLTIVGDDMANTEGKVKVDKDLMPPPEINTDYKPIEPPIEVISLFPAQKTPVFYINTVKATTETGQSLADISKVYKKSIKRLLKYNDLGKDTSLLDGQYVFLKKKKKVFEGKVGVHEVKEKETMYSIAQLYGIKLKSLLKRNRLEKGQEPVVGACIELKCRKAKTPPELKK